MKRIDVTKTADGWVARTGNRTVLTTANKQDAVRQAAALARSGERPASVRIHKVDGHIQEERTYPTSADPRRSPG